MRSIKITFWIVFNSAMCFASAQDTTFTEEIDCNKVEYLSAELIPFEHNKKCHADAYPYISQDGQHLYYTFNLNEDWIYYSAKKQNSHWSKPIPIIIDNFSSPIMSCYLTPDLKTMYFTSLNKFYKCESVDGSTTHFSQVETINIENQNMVPFSYISFSPDGKQMYAYSSSSTARYEKIDENNFAFEEISTDFKNEMGFISADGLRYYFTIDQQPNILFYKKRSSMDEAFSTTNYIFKTFESHLDIGQIRIASKANQMVLVLTNNNWENNELYFFNTDFNDSLHKDTMDINKFDLVEDESEIDEPVTLPKSLAIPLINEDLLIPTVINTTPTKQLEINNNNGFSIYKIEVGTPYPNPAKGTINFTYSIQTLEAANSLPEFVLTDNTGQIIFSGQLKELIGNAKIELPELASGAYFLKINYKGLTSPVNKIMVLN